MNQYPVLLGRFFRVLAAFLLCHCALHATQVGDTLEAVMEERGKPTSRAELKGTVILNYPDAAIHLEDGVVTAIKAKTPSKGSGVKAVPTKKPAATLTNSDAATSEGWLTSFPQARDEAKASGRRVMLFFTGSDWCGWCKRLKREVLDTPEFMEYAGENLVLLELDFPKQKAIDAQTRQQNEELAQAFGIRGFPTVIILSPEMKPLKKMGYQEGGAKVYIQSLESI